MSWNSTDLEAQADRNKNGAIVNIIEERTIIQETMPEHLVGVLSTGGGELDDGPSDLSDHPYAADTVRGHFPRLSKS